MDSRSTARVVKLCVNIITLVSGNIIVRYREKSTTISAHYFESGLGNGLGHNCLIR